VQPTAAARRRRRGAGSAREEVERKEAMAWKGVELPGAGPARATDHASSSRFAHTNPEWVETLPIHATIAVDVRRRNQTNAPR
jgi:hypothetical protein